MRILAHTHTHTHTETHAHTTIPPQVFARPQVLVLQLVPAAISLDELQSLHTKPQLLANRHDAHVPKQTLLAAAAKVFDPAIEDGRRRLRELGMVRGRLVIGDPRTF